MPSVLVYGGSTAGPVVMLSVGGRMPDATEGFKGVVTGRARARARARA